MTWGAIAVGGATLVGGYLAADKSAGAVEGAAQTSADASRYIYDKNVSLNDPFYKQGLSALPYLQAYTGVPGYGSTTVNADTRVKPTPPVMPSPNAGPAGEITRGIFGWGDTNNLEDPNRQVPYSGLQSMEQYNKEYADYVRKLAEYNASAGGQAGAGGNVPTVPLPSYEDTVTKPMESWNYEQSPAYKAKYTLGMEELNKQLQARGLAPSGVGASRAADLNRRLTAEDYAGERSYALGSKQDLYKGRYSENTDRYNRLLDQVKMGTGASAQMGQAGNQYASQVGQSAMQVGNAQAGFYSGLGGLIPQSVNTGLKAYDLGNKAGWWGANAASNPSAMQTASSNFGWSDAATGANVNSELNPAFYSI